MQNPYVVQYLESLHRSDGSFLCLPSANQILVPSVPPNTLLTYNTAPAPGVYAAIGYGVTFDHAIVPGSFRMTIVQWGAQPISGILTSDLIANGIEYIGFVTSSQKAASSITNITPMNQYLCLTGYYLNIISQEDYVEVVNALRKLGTVDAVKILNTIAGAKNPLPPEGST